MDLFAGVGLFSVPLARAFQHVTAVERASPAARDLRSNVPANVKAVCADVATFMRRKSPPLDYVVADPPRGGLGPGVCASLAAMAVPQIAYVSCDPATLARDLKSLFASGYRISKLHLFDLFPQTFHIESLAELAHT